MWQVGGPGLPGGAVAGRVTGPDAPDACRPGGWDGADRSGTGHPENGVHHSWWVTCYWERLGIPWGGIRTGGSDG